MMGFGSWGFGLGFALVKVFALAFGLGLVFFIIWAVKSLDKKALKTWTIVLLLVGVLGLILSGVVGMYGKGWSKSFGWNGFERCFDVEAPATDVVPEVVE